MYYLSFLQTDIFGFYLWPILSIIANFNYITYLKGRENRGTEREKERAPFCWFTSQVSEPRTQSKSLTWVTETQERGVITYCHTQYVLQKAGVKDQLQGGTQEL